eukprot:m.93677 g.93677  ORF g.93677 m.93677 type:complete len:471 (-) comp12165_c0_seq1:210-1622(-)
MADDPQPPGAVDGPASTNTPTTEQVEAPTVPPPPTDTPPGVVLRVLAESELEEWFDLLEAVYLPDFGLPRRYFERHWHSDPTCSVADVLVAIVSPAAATNSAEAQAPAAEAPAATAGLAAETPQPRFVSSLRVFRRTVLVDGQPVALGGIGEVGTLPTWRGRGVASALLRFSVEHMERTGVEISGLHGVAAATPLYARLGWIPASTPMVDLQLQGQGGSSSDGAARVAPNARPTALNAALRSVLSRATHPIDIDDAATRGRLAATYAGFASAELPGAVVRDEAYWGQWIREPAEGYAPGRQGEPERRVIRGWEVRDSTAAAVGGVGAALAYIFIKVGATAGEQVDAANAAATTTDGADLSAASAAPTSPPKTVINVLDFAATSGPTADKTEVWLQYLLQVAVEALATEESGEVVARVPAALLHQGDSRPDTFEPTSKWMYRVVSPSAAARTAVETLTQSARHYVAAIDEY